MNRSDKNTKQAQNTAIGEVIEQLRDHRVRADAPARFEFHADKATNVIPRSLGLRFYAD